jgi:hypothetical protein
VVKHKKRLENCGKKREFQNVEMGLIGPRKQLEVRPAEGQFNDGEKIGNLEVIPQAIWLIAKSLMNRNGQNAPSTLQCHLGLNFHPLETANAIADRFEKQFTPHDLCNDSE